MIRKATENDITAIAKLYNDVIITVCDGKILSAMSMAADESMLTGESLPAEKKVFSGGDTGHPAGKFFKPVPINNNGNVS